MNDSPTSEDYTRLLASYAVLRRSTLVSIGAALGIAVITLALGVWMLATIAGITTDVAALRAGMQMPPSQPPAITTASATLPASPQPEPSWRPARRLV